MLDKSYWTEVKEQILKQLESTEGAMEQDRVLLVLCDDKLKEFEGKEEKDEMPEAVKEIVSEVKQ